VRFRATIEQSGKTATGIRVPPEVVDQLGAGKRPAVRVTINGYTYRTTIGVMGGVSMLPLSAEHRQAAGLAAGDEVEVELELDTEPREVIVPADLAAALEEDASAQRAFNQLSYSARRRHVLSVEGARTPETRGRRIHAVIGSLRKDSDADSTGG
jgi:antitoxin component of MazEF toxin-antitoxin module